MKRLRPRRNPAAPGSGQPHRAEKWRVILLAVQNVLARCIGCTTYIGSGMACTRNDYFSTIMEALLLAMKMQLPLVGIGRRAEPAGLLARKLRGSMFIFIFCFVFFC